MLEDMIRELAADEGWSDTTLVAVLIGVLEDVARGNVDASSAGIFDAVEERALG